MFEDSATRCMWEIERTVLKEVGQATLSFACPHCGCILEIHLDQSCLPDKFPCGEPFELILNRPN